MSASQIFNPGFGNDDIIGISASTVLLNVSQHTQFAKNSQKNVRNFVKFYEYCKKIVKFYEFCGKKIKIL